MNFARLIQFLLQRIVRAAAQRYEEALQPLGHALQTFLAVLFQQRPFPADWRGHWQKFLAVQEQDYVIDRQSADEVEHWIEWRAKRLGLLSEEPDAAVAPTSSEEFGSTASTPEEEAEFQKWMAGPNPYDLDPSNPSLPKSPSAELDEDANVAAILWLIKHPEENHPRIVRVKELKGLWTDYDSSIERGEGPNIFMRALWGVVRTALPSSEPSRAYFLDDGTIYVELSGGPTSGALGGQGTMLLTGLNVKSLGEALVDGLFQEATGAPVGPSLAKGLKSPKAITRAQPDAGARDPSPAPEVPKPVAEPPKVSVRSANYPLGGRGPTSGRSFDPANAGGAIRNLTTDRIQITHRGIDYAERHLSRFGPDGSNQLMIRRLRDIADGNLHPTQYDLNFYSHELRESVRYRRLGHPTGAGDDFDLWNNAHTGTLEDYRLPDFDANGNRTLYHPNAWHLFDDGRNGHEQH